MSKGRIGTRVKEQVLDPYPLTLIKEVGVH